MTKKEYIGQHQGEAVAILCARYWYRGIVAEVGDDCVVLKNPFAVEVTGTSTAEHPQTEDSIPSDLCVSFDAIEIICQPTWCFHGYKEDKK